MAEQYEDISMNSTIGDYTVIGKRKIQRKT